MACGLATVSDGIGRDNACPINLFTPPPPRIARVCLNRRDPPGCSAARAAAHSSLFCRRTGRGQEKRDQFLTTRLLT